MTGDRFRPQVLLALDGAWAATPGTVPDAVVVDVAGRGADEIAARVAAFGRNGVPPLVVRVSPPGAPGLDAEIAATLAACRPAAFRPAAFLVADLRGRPDLERIGAKLAVGEAEARLPAGSLAVIACAADTSQGVLALPGLAAARTTRLAGILFDGPALACSLGCEPTVAAVAAARAAAILAAAAAGVPAFDRLGGDVAEDGRSARREGFAGALVSRAEAVGPARKVFADLRPASDASSRTSSPASPRSIPGSRPA